MSTTTRNTLLALAVAMLLLLAALFVRPLIAQGETGCTHVCAAGECAFVEGVPCSYIHEHDEFCGYFAAT